MKMNSTRPSKHYGVTIIGNDVTIIGINGKKIRLQSIGKPHGSNDTTGGSFIASVENIGEINETGEIDFEVLFNVIHQILNGVAHESWDLQYNAGKPMTQSRGRIFSRETPEPEEKPAKKTFVPKTINKIKR